MDEKLWDRVNAELDARRNPFEDEELAAALARDPETESAVRRLLQRLPVLPTPAPLPRARTPWPALLAAAAFLVLCLPVFQTGNDGLIPVASNAEMPRPPRQDRELSVRLSISTTTPPRSPARPRDLSPRNILTWNLEGVR